MIPAPHRAAALPDLGVLDVAGDDAAAFLGAQLSQRMPLEGSGQACLAGWHDPKGRVRSLCRVLAVSGRLLLLAERASLSLLAGALDRYVLRANVRLADVSDAWHAAALLDTDSAGAPAAGTGTPDAWQAGTAAVYTLRIGPGLRYVLGTPAQIAAVGATLPAVAQDAVARAEIGLGLPPLGYWPEPKFLGQMLNLDRLGAIAFDKGCFPGQEILTRAHRLGDVKRRLHRYAGALPPPPPGAALLDAGQQVVGEVVRAVGTDAGCELLAVTPNDAPYTELVCAAAPAAPLRRLPLPTDAPVEPGRPG